MRHKTNPSSFNFNQALLNLIGVSPDGIVKSFKSRLDRAFSHSTPSNGTSRKQLYTLLCYSLVERASHYDDCIKELRRLVSCVSSSGQDPNVIIAHHTFPVKPWLTAIKDLSDCKIHVNTNDSAYIRCNFKQRLPKITSRQIKYIYEKILDRQIRRRSPLYYIANELGSVLARSRWGKQFAYDMCQYFAIYQEGRRKLRTLSKITAKDQRDAARLTMFYNKLYNNVTLSVEH